MQIHVLHTSAGISVLQDYMHVVLYLISEVIETKRLQTFGYLT